MTSLESEISTPSAHLDEVVQRIEVGTLLGRYLLGLDQNRIDDAWALSIFTPDARVEFPVGHHEGVDGLAAFHQAAMAKFERTQHLNSDAVVDLDGDRAVLQANLISTQVLRSAPASSGTDRPLLFTTGTYVDGEALHTTDGWRLRRLSFRLVWATGNPPKPAGQG